VTLKGVEKLAAKGVRLKVQLVTLLKEHAETLLRAAALPFSLEQVRAQRHELHEQEKELRQIYRISVLAEQAKLKASLRENLLLVPILRSSLARYSIYTPVDGLMNQINFMSENAFVKKGEGVAELTPKAVELLVHAQIDPKDIPNIAKGDSVRMRLSTIDSNQFANLDGYVQRISAAVIKASKSDKRFYLTRISIKRHPSGAFHDRPRLRPGMKIDFNILSGKRTVLDYIAQPVARVQKRAFWD
jgi:membrane fusion protein, adhesin transport system